MYDFNPWIDAGIIFGFLAVLGVICYIGDKYTKHQKSKLRGATRIA